MAAKETHEMSKLDEFASVMGLIRGTGSNGLSPSSRIPEDRRGRTLISIFVRRLWEMVTDGVILHWHHTGLAIVVNVRVYETNVRQLYSKNNRTNKFSFFHRQLTCHSFIRLTRDHLDDCLATDPWLAVFFHGCFRRDKPDLLWKIRSLPRVETGERINTEDSCEGRHRQTVDIVPLPKTAFTAAGEPECGRVPTNVNVPQITEEGPPRCRARSTSQPSTRGQQTFADFINQPFCRSRTPPMTRPTRKRRRPQSSVTNRPPSHAVPVGRLPEIIFVPHLVTVNGLFPLEPCYDFWKHGSFQTAMAAERTQAPGPWPQHGVHRDSHGDGKFVNRHPSFTPYPRLAVRPLATRHVTPGVTGGETGHNAATSFDNGICFKEYQERAWNSETDGGLNPPDGRVQTGENVEEPTSTCNNVDGSSYKRGDHVANSVKFTNTFGKQDSAPAPVKVWQRPPPHMDPFVILEKLML